MNIVKNVGDKLDTRIKSGDISEKELFSEASDIMNNMKNMPGMENIQSMMKQMGMNANMNANNLNPNIDTNAMKKQNQLEKMKERINKRHPQQTQICSTYLSHSKLTLGTEFCATHLLTSKARAS